MRGSRKCRHLTPNTDTLVSWARYFGSRSLSGHERRCNAILFAKVTSWRRGCNLLHPLGNGHREEQALGAAGVPGRPGHRPKDTSSFPLVFKGYETLKRMVCDQKVGFRYRQAEIAGIVQWLRGWSVPSHRIGGEVVRATRTLPNISASTSPLRNCNRFSRDGQSKFLGRMLRRRKEQQASDVLSLSRSGAANA